MKKLFLSLCMSLCAATTLHAQSADPEVMKINGKSILRSEFEYFYNKNNEATATAGSQTSVNDYVDMVINYRLKVQAALDEKLDTLSSFKKEFSGYRDAQLRPYLTDPEYEDSIAQAVYKAMKEQVGDSELVLVSHIMMVLPQKCTDAVKAAKKTRIDSVYQALQNGADFIELAKKCSEDFTTAQKGGELPWIAPGQTLPEFEKEAYALQPGQYSKPFLSTVGYHIVYMKERKKLEPYEQKKAEIMELLNARGIKDMAAEHRIKRLMEESKGQSREEVIARVQKEACQDQPELKYLIEEYHDGLLLYEASNRLVWQKAAKDKEGLTKYFKKNKKKYAWDAPRYRGYIIYAKSEQLLQQAREFFKKQETEEGVAEFNKSMPQDSLKKVRVRYGVFRQGDEPIVDWEAFGKEEPKANTVFPFRGCQGVMLNQPKLYNDVKAQVVSDYQDVKEKEWVKELRKKYSVTVNKEVLATVNKH